MLLIYADEQVWTEAEQEQCYGEATELAHTLKSNGQYLAASPLQPVSTATSVRVREGKRLVIDGPLMETREQLGGYFLIEVKDLDVAIEVAGRIPGARNGTVEIRPLVEIPNLPKACNTLFAESVDFGPRTLHLVVEAKGENDETIRDQTSEREQRRVVP